MLGFGKPPKTEAEKLADHVKTAKEAEAHQDWKTAARRYNRAAQMVGDASFDVWDGLIQDRLRCENKFDSIRVQARRKELGLS
jgi:hypothetical protein